MAKESSDGLTLDECAAITAQHVGCTLARARQLVRKAIKDGSLPYKIVGEGKFRKRDGRETPEH